MMKNVFYFMSKLFPFLRYLHFCLDFLLMLKNGLIRKLWFISRFMTSQTGQQIIIIHVLPNISRSKGNHAIKFGQLINYRVKNIVFQKPCKKWGRETCSRPLFVS